MTSNQSEIWNLYRGFSLADLIAARNFFRETMELRLRESQDMPAGPDRNEKAEVGRITARTNAVVISLITWRLMNGTGEIPEWESDEAQRHAGETNLEMKGDEIARICRPFIEQAKNLSHAYAIGHASMYEPFDHETVGAARRDRDLAKYVYQAWRRAGYLDADLDSDERCEELKRRIIRYADDGICPRVRKQGDVDAAALIAYHRAKGDR